MHFTERPPIFVGFVIEIPPFFDAICHRKTPTSEVIGGTSTLLSHVSAPPPGLIIVIWNESTKLHFTSYK